LFFDELSMSKFESLFFKLVKKYGKARNQWRLWCKRNKNEKEREEVAIGAILTQRTSWQNVEKAIENLKRAGLLSLRKISLTHQKKLTVFLKPTGFYQRKAECLLSFSKFVIKNYGSINDMKKVRLESLREELLKINGIGKETADSILLYALDKPIFVIDEYTRRIVKREHLTTDLSYDDLQKIFQDNLKKDFKIYQDFHALLVIECQSEKIKRI